MMRPRPLTVVHLITDLNTGGAEQMLYNVAVRMNRERFRNIVVSMTDRGMLGERIAAEGIPVMGLGMTLGRPSVKGFWNLYHFLRKERPDLLQTWLYHADLLGILAGRMARVSRVLWGVRCSEMDLKNYRFLTTLTVHLCAFLSPLTDAIIVNSEEGKRVHQRLGYHDGRMTVIPNGLDIDRFHPDPTSRDWLLGELDLDPEVVLIGLVARFDPMKDHRTFLKAAAKIEAEEGRVHFIMVGKGTDPQNLVLGALIRQEQLQDRVHLLGLREDIPRIMAALDVATSSSAYGEGSSNTIAEAMSCGVPCVVTDVGDSARIVGDTGLVVSPEDPDAFSDACLRVLHMGEQGRKELGSRARMRVVEHYKIEDAVRRFEQFYEGIIG